MALVYSVVYHILNLALISVVLQSLQNLHILKRRDELHSKGQIGCSSVKIIGLRERVV